MTQTVNHGQIANVKDNGDIDIFYPKTFSKDVYVNSDKKTLEEFIGTTNISAIADGTLTGCIQNIDTREQTNANAISGLTGTVSGHTTQLDGITFHKNGTTYGYYDNGGNFKSFRQPTGNAAAGDVLSGKTFANASSDNLTGSMPNRGAVSQSLNPGGSYTIPAGYHNGSGKVTANSMSGTYSVKSTGNVDMGVNNTYRYVNADSVYNSGIAAGRWSMGGTQQHHTNNVWYGYGTGNHRVGVAINIGNNRAYITMAVTSISDSYNGVIVGSVAYADRCASQFDQVSFTQSLALLDKWVACTNIGIRASFTENTVITVYSPEFSAPGGMAIAVSIYWL